MVILSGGIDLSVGSILALSAVTIGFLIENGYPPALATVAGVAIGTLCGFINGIIITKGRIAPFIATLGMMGIARGFALVITKGVSYMVLVPFFDVIGNGKILGLPIPIVIVIIVFIVLYVAAAPDGVRQACLCHRRQRECEPVWREFRSIGKRSSSTRSADSLPPLAALVMIGRLASTPSACGPGSRTPGHCGGDHRRHEFYRWLRRPSATTLIGAMIMAMITKRSEHPWRVLRSGNRCSSAW